MNVIVKEEFRDKYTDEVYKSGTKLEITEERFNEILEVGNFVEEYKESKKTKKKKDK